MKTSDGIEIHPVISIEFEEFGFFVEEYPGIGDLVYAMEDIPGVVGHWCSLEGEPQLELILTDDACVETVMSAAIEVLRHLKRYKEEEKKRWR